MSVQAIRVFLDCDRCGAGFSVALDPATACVTGWSAWDLAVDAVRGSCDYRPADARWWRFGALASVQGGQMLCDRCTTEVDAVTEEHDHASDAG
jgi:hypothetical protein